MKTQIRAHELPGLLDRVPAGIKVLSLDCFDTLLWRDTHAPRDVFTELDIPGGAIEPRQRAEAAARRQARFEQGRSEVTIEQIHRRFRPTAAEAELMKSVADELDAEARRCFGFAPTVALVERAKARGLRVIIVSDTYLSEPQLRALIAAAAGEPVAEAIDRIFCSSEHGLCKGEGLFKLVLEALGVAPDAILHVGDNKGADQTAPAAIGIPSAHLRQFDDAARSRLRLEAAASQLIDPRVRASLPAFQPHRPLVSSRVEDEAAWTLGHDVLGPLLAGFADWVRAEAEAIAAAEGKPPHILFLLRDGHLPKLVFDALHPDRAGAAVEISRLTAARASFIDEAAIRAHLAAESERSRCDVLVKQLNFDKAEAAKLAHDLAARPDKAFFDAVLRPSNVTQIIARSGRAADRLIAHLKAAGVRQGDSVMFIDLGYNGSVQNLAEPMLAKRMGLKVHGRYLLLREDAPSALDKRGYLDTRHYDYATLNALCDPIAVVEQLCTVAQGSTVDYKPDGAPVRDTAGVKGAQNAVRDRVQAGAVAYAQAWRAGGHSVEPEPQRIAAAATLARLLFMPLPSEIALLEAFDHDVNLGTRDMVRMIDADASVEGLRRSGMFYLNEAKRMYLPAELRRHGLPLNLALLTARRFGLELTRGDFNGEAIKLPVILADARGEVPLEVDAWPTHDGYYAAAIPVGAGRFSVGVSWGRIAEWVQIDEAAFHRVESFGAGKHAPIAAASLFDGMERQADGLYRTSEAGFMLIPPPAATGTAALLLNIVFRPVVRRGAAVEARKAA